MKYQRISLADLISAEQMEVSKRDFAELTQDEKQRILPYILHYIAVAIRERFPDISKKSLHTRCLRIVHKEFASAYQD